MRQMVKLNFIPCFYWKNVKHFEACRSCRKTLPGTEQEVIWCLSTWEIVFQCSTLIQWNAFVLLCCKTMFLYPADTDWSDHFLKLGQISAVFTLLSFCCAGIIFLCQIFAGTVYVMIDVASEELTDVKGECHVKEDELFNCLHRAQRK